MLSAISTRLLRPLPVVALLAIAFSGGSPAQIASKQDAGKKQDSGKKLYVITHVDTNRDDAGNAAKLMQQFAANSRKEPGAVRFEVLQETSRVNHFTIVEVWDSQNAFEAHLSSEHAKLFREKLQPMLGSPFDERLHYVLP